MDSFICSCFLTHILSVLAGRSRSLLQDVASDMKVKDVSLDNIIASAKELLGADVDLDPIDLLKVAAHYERSEVGKSFEPSMEVVTKQLVDIVNETEVVLRHEERKMADISRWHKDNIPSTGVVHDTADTVDIVNSKIKRVVKMEKGDL